MCEINFEWYSLKFIFLILKFIFNLQKLSHCPKTICHYDRLKDEISHEVALILIDTVEPDWVTSMRYLLLTAREIYKSLRKTLHRFLKWEVLKVVSRADHGQLRVQRATTRGHPFPIRLPLTILRLRLLCNYASSHPRAPSRTASPQGLLNRFSISFSSSNWDLCKICAQIWYETVCVNT